MTREQLPPSRTTSSQASQAPPARIARILTDSRLPAPELALMRAVLEDAIHCYRGRARRRRIDPRILQREADYWFRLRDWDSAFSFNNVCDALGLDVESTRLAILGTGSPAPPTCKGKAAAERR